MLSPLNEDSPKGERADMRKYDSKTRAKVIRKTYEEKLPELGVKTGESEERRDRSRGTMIKSLAGAQWNEIEKIKGELKTLLPILTPSEVKRFYLPFHEAVTDELEENGYVKSANFLKALFELDEKVREEAGPDTLIWKKPRLRNNKDAVTRLKEGLIASENFEKIGNLTSATIELLKMTQFFQSMTWEWWFVAEQLFRSALTKAELIEDDKQRTITLACYLYGRFLLERAQDIAKSVGYLEVAREATRERSWNASRVTGEEKTIYYLCNVLLYRALLMHARQLDPSQPGVIVQTCDEALARAKDSGDYEYVANALYELGKSQLRARDVKVAFRNFTRLLAMAKRVPDPEGICNAHKGMALAYKELKDETNTSKHLRLIIESAAEFGLTEKLAQANYFAGEHFINERKPDVATPHLETSLNLYSELGLNVDADRARIMAGVSKGQEIIARYIDLILQCATTDSPAISLLCGWKNNRSAFWTEEKPRSEEPDIESENVEATSTSLSTLISRLENFKT